MTNDDSQCIDAELQSEPGERDQHMAGIRFTGRERRRASDESRTRMVDRPAMHADSGTSARDMHRFKVETRCTEVEKRLTEVGMYCTEVEIHCTEVEIHCTEVDIHCTEVDIHCTEVEIHCTEVEILCTEREQLMADVD